MGFVAGYVGQSRTLTRQDTDKLSTLTGHARAGDDPVEPDALGPFARLHIDVRIKAERRD